MPTAGKFKSTAQISASSRSRGVRGGSAPAWGAACGAIARIRSRMASGFRKFRCDTEVVDAPPASEGGRRNRLPHHGRGRIRSGGAGGFACGWPYAILHCCRMRCGQTKYVRPPYPLFATRFQKQPYRPDCADSQPKRNLHTLQAAISGDFARMREHAMLHPAAEHATAYRKVSTTIAPLSMRKIIAPVSHSCQSDPSHER